MANELERFAKTDQWRAQVAARFGQLPTNYLTGSKTYDPPSINNGAQAQTTVTVTGAAIGNVAMAAFSLDLQGMTISAAVSAADTVTVTIRNNTGGGIDLASGTLSASVFA